METINTLGIMFNQASAEAARDIFNRTKVAMTRREDRADNNLPSSDDTTERAVIVSLTNQNTIMGWLVKIETRGYEERGKPWRG